jgi:hypothetical protein
VRGGAAGTEGAEAPGNAYGSAGPAAPLSTRSSSPSRHQTPAAQRPAGGSSGSADVGGAQNVTFAAPGGAPPPARASSAAAVSASSSASSASSSSRAVNMAALLARFSDDFLQPNVLTVSGARHGQPGLVAYEPPLDSLLFLPFPPHFPFPLCHLSRVFKRSQFFNAHKTALLAMFSKHAGGTARLSRFAAADFAQDYRIVPGALSADDVSRLVAEVLRT